MKKCVTKLKIFCNGKEQESDSDPVLLRINPKPNEQSVETLQPTCLLQRSR